ncbi:MAG: hypothetical protein AAB229_04070 [Candidatus Hydrogenedentota bacterium]
MLRCHQHLEKVRADLPAVVARAEFLRNSDEPMHMLVTAVLTEQLDYFEPELARSATLLYEKVLERFTRLGWKQAILLLDEELILENTMPDAMLLVREEDSEDAAAKLEAAGRLMAAGFMRVRLDQFDLAAPLLNRVIADGLVDDGTVIVLLPVFQALLRNKPDPDLAGRLLDVVRRYADLEGDPVLVERFRKDRMLVQQEILKQQMEIRARQSEDADGDSTRNAVKSVAAIGMLAVNPLLGGKMLYESTIGGIASASKNALQQLRSDARVEKTPYEKRAIELENRVKFAPLIIGNRKLEAFATLHEQLRADDPERNRLDEGWLRCAEENYKFALAARIADRIQPADARNYLLAANIVSHATLGDPRREILLDEDAAKALFRSIQQREFDAIFAVEDPTEACAGANT